jgi:hypothetical protein
MTHAKITKKDVFLCVANRLGRARRRELESARESDEQVRKWFEELTPSAEELAGMPRTTARPDPAESRRLSVMAFLSVERDEHSDEMILDFTRRARDRGESGAAPSVSPGGIAPLQLYRGTHGSLLYRKPAPRRLAAGNTVPSVPPVAVPWIEPDYDSGRLLIRQQLDEGSDGRVKLVVVRTGAETGVETVVERALQLRRVEPREGDPYWSEYVDLKSLIGDFHPGDDFIYCVEAAPGA